MAEDKDLKFFNTTLKWLLPLLACALLAPFTPKIDLALARAFYSEGHFFENGFTTFMYKYGEWVGFFFASLACLLCLLSWLHPHYKKWRQGALVLVLTWFLGAGLLINVVLKEHWGRPRPRQVEEFGGKHSFRPFYVPDFKSIEKKKSFPSGHVAVGAYYLSFCLVGWKMRQKALFYTGLFLVLFFGLGLFFCRVAQGGHFFSDALFSFLFMWLIALFSEWISYYLLPKFKKMIHS